MSADGLLDIWYEPEPPARRRPLPNRRECFTETIIVGNGVYDASIGFDAQGNPKEIFLSGAKSGTDMAAILADTAILVSIALQSGIGAATLADAISRKPPWPDAPSRVLCHSEPASVIGAALDLLARYEAEDWR